MMKTERGMDRRAFVAAGLGTIVAAGVTSTAAAAEPSAVEKANMQVVKDFCAAWPRGNGSWL